MAFVEMAKFKLRPGVTDEQFLDAERAIRAGQIQYQPGYLGRELARGDNGAWHILIRWEAAQHGAAWGEKFQKDPDGQAFAALLDFGSLRQEHATVLNI